MSASAAAAPPAPQLPVVAAQVSATKIGYDRRVVVTGQLAAGEVDHTLALDFLSSGAQHWRPLATTTVPASGAYRMSAPLRETGFVRVVDVTVAPASATGPTLGLSGQAGGAHRVAVTAKFTVSARSVRATGAPIAVSGHLLPGMSGRAVTLQGSRGGAWRTLASTRTGSAGAFTLRFTPGTGSERLRVVFAGDRYNAKTVAGAGSVTSAFQAAVASWYYDAGSTACGFHAYYGVANKTLPCGTRVTFEYHGRSLTATVDDRGPYIVGRTWDLNQNTAAALGFTGVDTVLAAY